MFSFIRLSIPYQVLILFDRLYCTVFFLSQLDVAIVFHPVCGISFKKPAHLKQRMQSHSLEVVRGKIVWNRRISLERMIWDPFSGEAYVGMHGVFYESGTRALQYNLLNFTWMIQKNQM